MVVGASTTSATWGRGDHGADLDEHEAVVAVLRMEVAEGDVGVEVAEGDMAARCCAWTSMRPPVHVRCSTKCM